MVPDTVIRAIAAAPQSSVRDVLLGSIGLTPALTALPEQERVRSVATLGDLYQKKEQEEIPW